MDATKLNQIKTRIAELRQQALDESKALFHSAVAEIFEKHPKLESFSWRQYTPYFNDGDECVFRRCEEYDIVYDGEEHEDCFWWKDEKPTEPLDCITKEVNDLLACIDEPVFKEMFGDHVSVKVSRNGVEVDEYCHD